MPDALEQLDRQYHEMRWRILSLAADLDRLERLPGGDALIANDIRIQRLRDCLKIVLEAPPGRAERVQMLLSDKSPVADVATAHS